jgi:predicted transcriptional regulator
MTRNVVSCRIGDDVREAMDLMKNERTSRVMVCDDHGMLKGVISLQDLAEERSDEEAGETLQEVKSDGPAAIH